MKALILSFIMCASMIAQTIPCLSFELRQEGKEDVVENGEFRSDRKISIYVNTENVNRVLLYPYLNIFDIQGNLFVTLPLSISPKEIKPVGKETIKLFEMNSKASPTQLAPGAYELVFSVVTEGAEPWLCRVPRSIRFRVIQMLVNPN